MLEDIIEGMPNYYTLKQVADILGVNRQTLYNHIRRGTFSAVKFGKEYRITEDQLKDILKNGYGKRPE